MMMTRARAFAAITEIIALSACGSAPSPDERLLEAGLDNLRQPGMLPSDAVIEQAFLSRWTEAGRTRNVICGTYLTAGQRIFFARPSIEDDHPLGFQNSAFGDPRPPPDWNRWCRHPVSDAAGRPVEYRQASR
jgi:hypothetical protein